MALSEFVTLTLVDGTTGVARAGFGVPMILSVNADWAERTRTYTGIEGVAEDFDTDSPEYLAANIIFSQEPHPEQIVIGRAIGKPTQRYQLNITTATAGYTYSIDVVGEGVTDTTATYTALDDLTVSAVTNGADSLTVVAHGMTTGDGPYRVSNSGGGLPAGLAVDTNYWVISLTADTFSLASSKADALALTPVNLTSDGTGTQTIRRSENDVICAQLVQGLNAVVGKNFTASQTTGAGETDYVVITATNPGDWFSLEVSDVSLMKIDQTHAEPGTSLATDITNIRNENDTWYALYTLYNSDAYVKAAAAAIEAVAKIYVADLVMSESATLANDGGDTGDDLQELNYDRTATVYSPSPAAMSGASWLGSRLPYDPGSATWMFAQPNGVSAVNVTDTQATNLVNKNINFIQTNAGVDAFREGVMVGGEFIDKIRDLDYLKDDLTKSIYECLVSNPIVTMDPLGLHQIETAIRGSLQRAADLRIIDADFEITVPTIAQISTANRALRRATGFKFTCRMQGAIHKVTITGVVSV